MRLGLALQVARAVGAASLARAAPIDAEARVELGGEYDSNPSRAETVTGAPAAAGVAPGSPLLRAAASGHLGLGIGARQQVALSAEAAGKVFSRESARGEDVFVGHASAAWVIRVHERTATGVGAAAADVFQRDGAAAPRAFRSVAPALRVEQGFTESLSGLLAAGYRLFVFKPARDFDFRGPALSASLRGGRPAAGDGGADWDGSAALGVELRSFSGLACSAADLCPPQAPAPRREDRFWTAQIEASRTSGFLLGAGVGAHLNASNSYGEALVRGLVHARAVFLLPWRFTLSARAELVATRYRDPVPLARNLVTGAPLASIEDETRSTARVEIVRPAGEHLDAGVRYTLYTNEMAAGPSRYRRHTALVFVAVRGGYGR